MNYPKSALAALIVLRIAIGWHFFYEGMIKIFSNSWTSKAYLLDSGGFAKIFFKWIAHHDTALVIADHLNAWGLTLIGLALVAGIFTRFASIAGMVMMGLYYLAHPAFPGIAYLLPSDGNYFIVNKTLIELVALWVVFALPTSEIVGLYRIMNKVKWKRSSAKATE